MSGKNKKRLEDLEKQSKKQDGDEITVKVIWMDEDDNIHERIEKRKRGDAPPGGSITVDWS